MIDNYPKELIQNREMIEGNFIFCLWSEPDSFLDYDKEIVCDKTFITEDGQFYYSLGLEMAKKGYRSLDDASIYTFVGENSTLKNGYERRGGYHTVKNMLGIVDIQNTESYYDALCKNNFLISLYEQGFNVVKHIDKLNKMTNQEAVDYYDYILNSASLSKTTGVKIETLGLSGFIDKFNNGHQKGVNFGKKCPIMNYLTLGLPKGDITAFASYSNGGKTSFVAENIIFPIAETKKKTCIISNEQQIEVYQILLLVHVLTERLDYWKLTRKKIKSGGYTEEEIEMISKAEKIVEEEYEPYLSFVKTFDYNMSKVCKIIKKLAKTGLEVAVYDTMKVDSESDEVWKSLLNDSKMLFQTVSKEGVAGVVTVQLALHMQAKRFLSMQCFANGKQISEVMSEIIMFRDLWEDEREGEKFDVKPYRHKKDSNGKITGVKEIIKLDPEKKYKLMFHVKTRNDEADNVLVYEFNGQWNKWKELGFANPIHDRTFR